MSGLGESTGKTLLESVLGEEVQTQKEGEESLRKEGGMEATMGGGREGGVREGEGGREDARKAGLHDGGVARKGERGVGGWGGTGGGAKVNLSGEDQGARGGRAGGLAKFCLGVKNWRQLTNFAGEIKAGPLAEGLAEANQ